MIEISQEKLAGGEFGEQFNEAAKRVVANLLDPNTPYKIKRGITAKLTFEQNESRNDMVVSICVETKLAPQSPIRTNFAVGKDLRTGELYLQEYGKGIPGQVSIKDYDDGEYKIGTTQERENA